MTDRSRARLWVISAVLALFGGLLVAMGSTASAATRPAAPTNLHVVSHDARSVELAWQSSAPLDGYTTFNVYADGFLVTRSGSTSASACCLTPGQTYSMTVTVTGKSTAAEPGLESAPSAPVSVTLDADRTAPPTPSHFQLASRSGSSLTFHWDWTTDNTGTVQQYELSYAGNKIMINHGYPEETVDMSGLNLAAGQSYTIGLSAVDAVGNRSTTPATINFETTPPSRVQGLHVVGSSDTVAWDPATDNSGSMRGYEVFYNNASLGVTSGNATSIDMSDAYFGTFFEDAPSGPATVQIRAIDPSLNRGQLSTSVTVVLP